MSPTSGNSNLSSLQTSLLLSVTCPQQGLACAGRSPGSFIVFFFAVLGVGEPRLVLTKAFPLCRGEPCLTLSRRFASGRALPRHAIVDVSNRFPKFLRQQSKYFEMFRLIVL